MDDQTTDREGDELRTVKKRVGRIVLCLLVIVVAPLLPLLIEGIESALFNSHSTSVFFQRVGLFEPLKALYQWLGLINQAT
jgi:hypothetical protein